MTTESAASRFNEHSVLGIVASMGAAVGLGYLFNKLDAPAAVQGAVVAGAVGLPAAIAYSVQGRRRDATRPRMSPVSDRVCCAGQFLSSWRC